MSKQTAFPPLNPLHVFEVASRLLSFTKAAEELNVTQSAVSRQIATLESYLNVLLFHRGRDGISLTQAGEVYRKEVGPAFARILAATNELKANKLADPLRLRVYTTFAARWLIPRLAAFKEKHPQIDIRMNTSAEPVDFSRDSADIAIQFGAGEWTGVLSKKIMDDVIQPVCSPELIEKVGAIESVGDLDNVQLISARLRSRDWRDWLEARGQTAEGRDFMEFPSSHLAYQAALLFGKPFVRDMGYYAIWPETMSVSSKMRAFLNWVVEEARGDDEFINKWLQNRLSGAGGMRG